MLHHSATDRDLTDIYLNENLRDHNFKLSILNTHHTTEAHHYPKQSMFYIVQLTQMTSLQSTKSSPPYLKVELNSATFRACMTTSSSAMQLRVSMLFIMHLLLPDSCKVRSGEMILHVSQQSYSGSSHLHLDTTQSQTPLCDYSSKSQKTAGQL